MKHLQSSDNPLIKHLSKLVRDKSYRYEQKTVVIEGLTMVREIAPHASLQRVLATENALFPDDFHGEKILVDSPLIEKICQTKNPEGIIAEVSMPLAGNLQESAYILVLDRIADPGNLGTLLRTALALGWEGAYLLEGCCDPFNDKSLRAAKGATFRIPLYQGGWPELKKLIAVGDWQVLGADLGGSTSDTIVPAEKRMLILGSESQGLSDEARKIGTPVTIPIQKIDSLNVAVAGGILMAQLIKDSREKD